MAAARAPRGVDASGLVATLYEVAELDESDLETVLYQLEVVDREPHPVAGLPGLIGPAARPTLTEGAPMPPDGNQDPDYPPDPPTGLCTVEHGSAMGKYVDMKKAESDAVNAVRKARNVAATAAVACAVGQMIPGAKAGATAACVAGVAATIAALDDAKSKNDIYRISSTAYEMEKQKLVDCINTSDITIELD